MDDNNTTATVSLIVYYTEEFRRATPDPQGHIDGLIVTANLGFVNSDIPLRLAVHCTLETDIGEAPTSKGRLRQFFESQGERKKWISNHWFFLVSCVISLQCLKPAGHESVMYVTLNLYWYLFFSCREYRGPSAISRFCTPPDRICSW